MLATTVLPMLQGKLPSFLAVAAQTLESFVTSLDEEAKTETEDHNSYEHQFVLAVAGVIASKFIASFFSFFFSGTLEYKGSNVSLSL